MQTFKLTDASVVTDKLIEAIQENKQYLSDIDGLIGDGDHGINMNKGFTMTREALDKNPGDFAHGLKTLAKILMMRIGGSMGPLYGKFFKAIAISLAGKEEVTAADFSAALQQIIDDLAAISPAKVGDKTLMDCLVPAVDTFKTSVEAGDEFDVALEKMVEAAKVGRDSTKDLVAQLGRASRLGERSRGVLDAGAASCCLIIETMAGSIKPLLS